MSRNRGNARKKKSRLTEKTLSAVMDVAGPRVESEQVSALPEVEVEPVLSSILEMLRAEAIAPTMPEMYNDASRALSIAPDYPASRYIIGLAVCSDCHCENIYYQDRDLLVVGYTFRCRVCQHELHATVE